MCASICEFTFVQHELSSSLQWQKACLLAFRPRQNPPGKTFGLGILFDCPNSWCSRWNHGRSFEAGMPGRWSTRCWRDTVLPHPPGSHWIPSLSVSWQHTQGRNPNSYPVCVYISQRPFSSTFADLPVECAVLDDRWIQSSLWWYRW